MERVNDLVFSQFFMATEYKIILYYLEHTEIKLCYTQLKKNIYFYLFCRTIKFHTFNTYNEIYRNQLDRLKNIMFYFKKRL